MSQGFTSQLPVPLPTAQGGTGLTSTTAYAVLCGGTTSTGNLQSIASVGTSGQVLTSNGAGALPTFQNASSGTGNVVAWVQFRGATPTIAGSGNVSSITKNANGDFTINFTSALSSANYSATSGVSWTGALSQNICLMYNSASGAVAPTTSAVRLFVSNYAAIGGYNPDYCGVTVVL